MSEQGIDEVRREAVAQAERETTERGTHLFRHQPHAYPPPPPITRRALIAGGAALAMVPMPSVDALWTHDRLKGRWVRPYRGGVLLFTDALGWMPSDMERLLSLAEQGDRGAYINEVRPGRWDITTTARTRAHKLSIAASKRAYQGGRVPPHGHAFIVV